VKIRFTHIQVRYIWKLVSATE